MAEAAATCAAISASAPAQLYALVDLARAPQLLPLIDALTRTGAARCLFEGRIAEPLRRASPHIVAVARAPGLMDRWQAEGRGQSWGVFLETPLPMHLARRHVRRFMQVKLPDGSGPVLMRVWDPRVLRVLAESRGGLWNDLIDETAFWVEQDDEKLCRADQRGHLTLQWQAFVERPVASGGSVC